MHEEPIDRSRDPWIERKRRLDQEEAIRREELLEARYRSTHETNHRISPPSSGGRSDPRFGAPFPSSSRNGTTPRSQPPPLGNLPSASDEQSMRGLEDAASAALKRRRVGDGPERDDRRHEDLGPGGRSPPFRRGGDLAPPSSHPGQRYLDERGAYPEDRSPLNSQTPLRPNGRMSPLDRPARSPGSGGGPLPPMQDMHRPSVLNSAGYDDSFEHSSSMPGLARRRGDAAQAKASRLHIDTGSSSVFDSVSRSAGVAKSAPPQKLSFGNDVREPPPPFDQAPRDGPRYGPQGPGSGHLPAPLRPDQRAISGSRLSEHPDLLRNEDREDALGLRDGRMPDMPHTANPLARQAPATRLPGGYVPQTATLPSPAYHTTQFARGPGGARGAYNPPVTARLPEHLRSPPASKAHFLSLFSDFYESLYDSRTLKATLEDQIKRSNTLLQTLQSSRRVLEETVERRVREERVLWEGRVRGLEARVRELESSSGESHRAEAAPRSSTTTTAPAAAAAESLGATDNAAAKDEGMSEEAKDGKSSSKSNPETTGDKNGADEDDEGDQLKDD